jgi:tRNA-splicing ligase RtcB (3'-phosphate/5'-hydroxy nucleic acid ligase)
MNVRVPRPDTGGQGLWSHGRHHKSRRRSSPGSRHHEPARSITGRELRHRLERQGIAVRAASARGLAEEAPSACKDITQVVEAAEGAGLCRKVARLVPLGVVKG